MTRNLALREEFDRDRNFEAVKPFKYNGAMFGPGQPFDKNNVTTRKLRQLYEMRYLKMMAVTIPRFDLVAQVEKLGADSLLPPPKRKVARVQLNR